MPEDPILDVLEDLLELEEIYACMVARRGMVSVIPDTEKFDERVMELWHLIKEAMDEVFQVIKKYSKAGLGEVEFRLQGYEVLFYILPKTESALVVIVPELSNKGLIEVEVENARNEILEILK